MNFSASQSMMVLVEVVAAEVTVPVRDDFTWNTPSPSSRIEMSNVPPPRSNTAIFSSFFLSSPYASEAAVGSLMMRLTVQTGHAARVLGGLALGVVEVRREP